MINHTILLKNKFTLQIQKNLYFNADNNNIPNNVRDSEIGKGEPGGHGPDSQFLNSQEDNTHRSDFKSKQEYFMAAHCNEPELNQRYPVKTTIQNKFDPIHVLLPHICGVINQQNHCQGLKTKACLIWERFLLRLIVHCKENCLMTNNKDKYLIDTGATRAIVNKAFYDKTPSLHLAPTFKLETPSAIRTPSQMNPYLIVEECVMLLVEIQGHVFKIYAYILPHMDVTYDLILGQKPLYELEGGPNFGTLTFTFMARSLELYNPKTIKISPGEVKQVSLEIMNCPKEFKNGKAICNLITNNKERRVQTMYLTVRNKRVQLEMDNNTLTDWVIPAKSVCGSIDMRSVGYFMILSQCLSGSGCSKDQENYD